MEDLDDPVSLHFFLEFNDKYMAGWRDGLAAFSSIFLKSFFSYLKIQEIIDCSEREWLA
jgi:hypothetical protein